MKVGLMASCDEDRVVVPALIKRVLITHMMTMIAHSERDFVTSQGGRLFMGDALITLGAGKAELRASDGRNFEVASSGIIKGLLCVDLLETVFFRVNNSFGKRYSKPREI